jgi:transketolase
LATIKKYGLSNLIIIVDNNKIQLDGTNADVKNLEPLNDKFIAFGFDVLETNGNDISAVIEALSNARMLSDNGKNVIIISHTIKGKGISFMENKAEWHGKAPNREQYEKALSELEANG